MSDAASDQAGEAIDRFLARRTRLAWRDVRHAIQQCRVTVDGIVCKHYHRALRPADLVALDGVVIADGPDDAVLICHKSVGVACSHLLADAPLIYDLVPSALRHPDLQTAGRLDRDTTGLIVLTIEGALIQRITSPKRELWKRYRFAYTGALVADAIQRVGVGLALPDDPSPCLPAWLTLSPDPSASGGAGTLEIREGRHHQVKRMIAALGGKITRLHRDRIGALELPADIQPGEMRAARPHELDALP